MKRMYLLLFLCFLVIGGVFAAGLSIKVAPKQVSINSNITIEYLIEQDEATQFSYQVGIKSPNETVTILNNTATGLSEGNTFQWNITNKQAGDYEAFVFLYPLTYMPAKFTIIPTMDFSATPDKLELYAYEETVVSSVSIINTGNTPVFISSSPAGFKSEATVLPITAQLSVGETKNFLISVKRPTEHYNASLTLTAIYENSTKTLTVPLMVYNPVVKINLLNISQEKTENATLVKGKIENAGNVYRNIKVVMVSTAGERTENMVVEANKTEDFSYEFAKTDKVKSIELKFVNSNGKEETISHSFSFLSMPNLEGLLSKLPILKGSKWIYIAGAIFLILAIGYLAFRRKPKPEVVIQPKPEGN